MVGRFLQGLQQRVVRVLVEPVGILDHDHVPVAAPRHDRDPRHQRTGLVDAHDHSRGFHHSNVAVPAGGHAGTGVAGAAAAAGAHQRGGEGLRRHRAPRSRRTGDEPGMGHGAVVRRPGDRPAELRDDRLLAHDAVPDAHGDATLPSPPASQPPPSLAVWRRRRPRSETVPARPVTASPHAPRGGSPALGLHPVAVPGPFQPYLRVEVQHDGQIRLDAVAGPPAQPAHLVHVQPGRAKPW